MRVCNDILHENSQQNPYYTCLLKMLEKIIKKNIAFKFTFTCAFVLMFIRLIILGIG